MIDEHKRFISENDEELKHVRHKNLQFGAGKAEGKEMSEKPIHVCDSDFNDVVAKHGLVLVDFWASWCGPCLALAPTIEELAREYSGKVVVGKLDVDENPVTAERFQVFSIPTVVVMKGGKEVDRVVGCVPKDHIEGVLKKHLG